MHPETAKESLIFEKMQFGREDRVRRNGSRQLHIVRGYNLFNATRSTAGSHTFLPLSGTSNWLNYYFMLQVIITSRFWRPVHQKINDNISMDHVIFGGPLDIAIAANTKFDVIFVDRLEMSGHTSHIYRVNRVMGMFRDLLKTQ